MSTSTLYHGPAAYAYGLRACEAYGELYFPPIGSEEDHPKKEDILRAVELSGITLPNGKEFGILVGPLDGLKTLDVLLKTLEEPPVPTAHMVLWAHDAAEVPSTILSRVNVVFCPLAYGDQDSPEEESVGLGDMNPMFLHATLQRFKGRMPVLVRGLIQSLDPSSPKDLRVFDALREIADAPVLTPSMVMAALWETSES
jgi:hypothetical protein